MDYPSLYNSANQGSIRAQNLFLTIIKAEYFLLLLVSIMSSTREYLKISPIIIVLILVVLAGLLVIKVIKKLDENWYKSRALAESVKTSTWRFCMRAHPFEDSNSIDLPKSNFRNFLKSILDANHSIAENLPPDLNDQVTNEMLKIRQLEHTERLTYYIKHRIDEQRKWYAKKSTWNRTAQRIWLYFTIFIYVVAAASLFSDQIGFNWLSLGFDPLIVLVTSAIGWLQIKRHGELTASYNITAHEIGIIKANSDNINTEKDLSDFVNESELAFSREHTQWVARKDAT